MKLISIDLFRAELTPGPDVLLHERIEVLRLPASRREEAERTGEPVDHVFDAALVIEMDGPRPRPLVFTAAVAYAGQNADHVQKLEAEDGPDGRNRDVIYGSYRLGRIGTYWVKVLANGEPLGEVPIRVEWADEDAS